MNTSYKGNITTFGFRFYRSILLLPLSFAAIYYFLNYRFANYDIPENYKIMLYILVLGLACYGIYYKSQRTRTVINELVFTENMLLLKGFDYNKKFEDKFSLDQILIELQQENLGKEKYRYCLELYSNDKYYYINKFNDWNYNTLKSVIDQYHLQTGRQISGMQFYTDLTNIQRQIVA